MFAECGVGIGVIPSGLMNRFEAKFAKYEGSHEGLRNRDKAHLVAVAAALASPPTLPPLTFR